MQKIHWKVPYFKDMSTSDWGFREHAARQGIGILPASKTAQGRMAKMRKVGRVGGGCEVVEGGDNSLEHWNGPQREDVKITWRCVS